MSRGTELVYPERKRCRTCRRYFGFEVIFGLYCSRKCAGLPPRLVVLQGLPEPVPPPADLDIFSLPRQSRHALWRGGRPKVRWRTAEDAAIAVAILFDDEEHTQFDVYQCEHCHWWHFGNRRVS